MIVRILGQGQWELPDSVLPRLNVLDDQVSGHVAAGDQAALAASLRELLGEIRANGTAVSDEDLRGSDLILPGPDASLAEVAGLLGDEGRSEGLIPG